MIRPISFRHEFFRLLPTVTRASAKNAEDTEAQRINFLLEPLQGSEKTALKGGKRRMVYVVRKNEKIIYVGEAKRELVTRMQTGFVAYRHFKRTDKKRGGYQGYKWIDLLLEGDRDELFVDAFLFGPEYDENRSFIEGIEGELVFLVRKETRRWPDYQNEIHFSNQPGAFETAQKIYQKIIESSNE